MMCAMQYSRTLGLNELLDGMVALPETTNRLISGISMDSREVREGMLFIAVQGETVDGSEYIEIAGYASTKEVDRVGDVIEPSAWQKGGLKNYTKNPILLFNHNYNEPVGVATTLSVDEYGLHIVGKVFKSAGKTYDMVKNAVLQKTGFAAPLTRVLSLLHMRISLHLKQKTGPVQVFQ